MQWAIILAVSRAAAITRRSPATPRHTPTRHAPAGAARLSELGAGRRAGQGLGCQRPARGGYKG